MFDYTYNIVSSELELLNQGLRKNIFGNLDGFNFIVDYFLSGNGKQIRSILGILVAKMLSDKELTEKQLKFLQVIELIHSATLVHDDVIDEAVIRRKQPSLNKKFGNKMAVLTGDYFLSCATKLLYEIGVEKLNRLFADLIKDICEGEIEQNLTLGQIVSMDEYLQKTQKKTALLFSLATQGIAVLSDMDDKVISWLDKFALNVGIAFQIKDDLRNFEEDESKPYLNDLKSGVYTLPVILLAQENREISGMLEKQQFDEVLLMINTSQVLKETEKIVESYKQKAVDELNKFQDNQYKQALIELVKNI